MSALNHGGVDEQRQEFVSMPSMLRESMDAEEITSLLNAERAEEIGKRAQERIDKITKTWTSRPSKVTPSMCRKLIDAWYRVYASALKVPMAGGVKYHATVEEDHLQELKESRGQATFDLTDTVVRWRLKDLEDQFGATDNLKAFTAAMRRRAKAKKPTENGKYGGWAYTNTIRRRGRVSQIPVQQLGRILVQYAGKAEFDPILLKRKVEVENAEGEIVEETVDDAMFYIGITPLQFAELIALKIVLGVEDEAECEETREIEANLRRTAKWLQRRADRPQDGGDLNPSELAKVPEKREKAQSNAQWNLGEVWYALQHGDRLVRGAWTYENTLNRVDERVSSTVVLAKSSVEEFDEEITTTTQTKGACRFLSRCENRSRAWIWDAPEGSYEEKATKCGSLKYNLKVCVDQKRVQEVVSNLVSLPVHDRPEIDRDEWFKVYGGRMVKDKTKPGAPEDYHGPSFVQVVRGKPKKAAECGMHDWYYEWKGLDPCIHSHITKAQIHKTWWTPKVHVKNWKCRECGVIQTADPEEYEQQMRTLGLSVVPNQACENCGSCKLYWHRTTVQGRKDQLKSGKFCNLCKTWDGCDCPSKFQRPKFESLDPDVSMPVLVPQLRRYIEQCVRERRFACAPRLEVVFKEGKFIGKKLENLQDLQHQVEMAEEWGDPVQFELRERMKQMRKEESEYSRTYKILHVFIPIDDDGQAIFNSAHLPSPFGKNRDHWAIHAQIYAKDLLLEEILSEFQGYVTTKRYTEDNKKVWHFKGQTTMRYRHLDMYMPGDKGQITVLDPVN